MTIKDARRFRKTHSAAAGAVAIALVAAACGNGEEAPSVDEVPSGGPIEITWYGSDARNAAVQDVIDWFSEDNPDIDITSQPTTFDAFWDRISVQAAANNVACVVAMQSRYQARYEVRGNLLALDGLIEDGVIDVSGIPEDILDSQRGADGNLYTIPYGIWFEGATLNVPQMEDHGLTPPDPDAGWDDYVDWAIAAQPEMPEGVYAIADRGDQITQFQAFLIERGENLFGEDEVGFSEESLIEWWELWQRAVEEGAAPSPEVTAEYAGVPQQQGMQAEGRILISSNGDNNISDVQLGLDHNDAGEVSIVRSPTGGEPQVVGANGWAIADNCENVVDSANFIDYFINSTDAAIRLETQTGLPPVTSILEEMTEDPEVSDAIKSRIELYFDLLDDGAVIDNWPDGTSQLVGQIGQSYEEVAFGGTSIEDAAEQFISTANSALSGF